ncbi:MAG: MBL fold metallo-hydrolase [Desulfuromonas sp.]|nr:MAG: MBL fold metallo-hydrolase [Desulfuromonas sp.]
MKIRILGCFGSRIPGRFTSSLLVDDKLLLDAGTISSALSQKEQLALEGIVLTHAHMDHIVDLAFLADNIFGRPESMPIWAPQPVLDAVQNHLFNDFVWPDFTKLPSKGEPTIKMIPLDDSGSGEVAGYRLKWARTNHPVHTVGYCVQGSDGSMFYSADTSTTDDLWQMARGCEDLKIAFVEASFPNRMENLAKISGHLTPAMLQQELLKFGDRDIPIKVFHMKPQFLEELQTELAALNDDRLQVLDGGEVFEV